MSLTRSASNPNYFADSDGNPVLLVGSHNWNNLQDQSSTPFDYSSYVDWMEKNNYNFMRLWEGDISPLDPLPYARTDGSQGMAADGKPKFDLTKFNQDYFDRLRERVIEAGEHGIYVSVMLFQGWSLDSKGGSQANPWPMHPF